MLLKLMKLSLARIPGQSGRWAGTAFIFAIEASMIPHVRRRCDGDGESSNVILVVLDSSLAPKSVTVGKREAEQSQSVVEHSLHILKG